MNTKHSGYLSIYKTMLTKTLHKPYLALFQRGPFMSLTMGTIATAFTKHISDDDIHVTINGYFIPKVN